MKIGGFTTLKRNIYMSRFEETYNIFLISEPHRPALPPSPNPAPDLVWENAARGDLQKIASTKVGNALLSSIRWHGIPVTIQPMPAGSCGDGTWPADDYIPPGQNSNLSTGPAIWYSPGNHDLSHKCEAKYKTFGQIRIEGHEVLLHELVHAFRMVSSKFNKLGAGKGFAFYNTTEEVNAVVVQGIYASERGTAIRASHTRHFPIDKELDTSFEFFQSGTDSYRYIKDFCIQNPGFTRMVARVYTRFNPLRAYYLDPARALRMSQTTIAKQRDVLQPIKADIFRALAKVLVGATP